MSKIPGLGNLVVNMNALDLGTEFLVGIAPLAKVHEYIVKRSQLPNENHYLPDISGSIKKWKIS